MSLQLPDKTHISPLFRLFNLEDRRGTYYVQFGFFEQSRYDFARFKDKPYTTVVDELPWDAAAMHSDNITVNIGAGQSRVVTSLTKKPNPSEAYWVYAIVTEPNYLKCETVELETNAKTTNTTAYNNTRTEEATEYKTLWELFIDWVVGLFD